MIYKFIKKYRSAFRVVKMCQVLEVSRSSYYNWLKRPVSTHQREDRILVKKMRRIHTTLGNMSPMEYERQYYYQEEVA